MMMEGIKWSSFFKRRGMGSDEDTDHLVVEENKR